jgi:hypothetical protein
MVHFCFGLLITNDLHAGKPLNIHKMRLGQHQRCVTGGAQCQTASKPKKVSQDAQRRCTAKGAPIELIHNRPHLFNYFL